MLIFSKTLTLTAYMKDIYIDTQNKCYLTQVTTPPPFQFDIILTFPCSSLFIHTRGIPAATELYLLSVFASLSR